MTVMGSWRSRLVGHAAIRAAVPLSFLGVSFATLSFAGNANLLYRPLTADPREGGYSPNGQSLDQRLRYWDPQ